ncbi:MAG: hypothetical protein NVSMB32_14840 [Actinomycetota bacterium]
MSIGSVCGADGVPGAYLRVVEASPRAYRLAGERDVSSAAPLADLLAAQAASGGDLTLELAELTFIDSAGLHLLIRTAASLQGRGSLRLIEPGRSVARVIETMGLERLDNLEVVGSDDGRWPGYGTAIPDAPGDSSEDPYVPPPAGG